MTVLALCLSGYHNTVSKKHGDVPSRMWRGLWSDCDEDMIPIDAITNYVHLPTWMNPRIQNLLDSHFYYVAPNWQEGPDDETIWNLVDEIPDKDLWELHTMLKNKLINRIRERKRMTWTKERDETANFVTESLFMNSSVLTIGFARRFTTYKRAYLIFHNLDRLKKNVSNRWTPVQITFVGKANQSNYEGKRILQNIY